MSNIMIPVGYMFKRVVATPTWLEANVVDIYSVSGCVSEDFADYINYWKHNGYWFFDSPKVMEVLSSDESIELGGTTLFYYEVYEYEFNEKLGSWVAFEPEKSFITNVQIPNGRHLRGFDVVNFSMHTSPECSPLCCNSLAKTIAVNEHCLFDSFDEAKNAIEHGLFKNSEPGPYRIFAVYTPTR